MSILACYECNKEVSDKAAACPHCGATAKAKAKAKGVSLGGVIFVLIVGAVLFSCVRGMKDGPGAAQPAAKSAAATQADAELNRAIAVGSLLKKSSKDPSSFKVNSFVIFPGGVACYEYRAKNSFGAIVPAQAVFIPPSEILTSERDRNKFVKSWNATCTKGGGSERAGGLNLLGVW
jgi:DNA-directed RNA polymerase subunit RPC12/RpoP